MQIMLIYFNTYVFKKVTECYNGEPWISWEVLGLEVKVAIFITNTIFITKTIFIINTIFITNANVMAIVVRKTMIVTTRTRDTS